MDLKRIGIRSTMSFPNHKPYFQVLGCQVFKRIFAVIKMSEPERGCSDSDIEAAKKCYSELLGMEPYFNVPGYAEFRVGDYQHELGRMINTHYLEILGQKGA